MIDQTMAISTHDDAQFSNKAHVAATPHADDALENTMEHKHCIKSVQWLVWQHIAKT